MISENQVMYDRMFQLFNQPYKPTHFNWEAQLLIGEDVVIDIDNVTTIDRVSDYLAEKADVLAVQLQLRQTDYIHRILPNKHRLRLKLSKREVSPTGESRFAKTHYHQTFYAFIADPQSPTLQMRSKQSGGGDFIDDLAGFQTITLQLIDEAYFLYRQIYDWGVFRKASISDVLRGLMTRTIKTPTQGEVRVGVDIVPPANKEVYPVRRVKPGVHLDDLPWYIQKRYGIYATGCGYYYQRGIWYIYPLIDFSRFDKALRKLYIILIPPDEMMGNDNNYYVEGDNVYVFATGDVSHTDYSEHTLNSSGNAYMYANDRNTLDRFYDPIPQSPTIPEGRNFHKVVVADTKRSFNTFAEPSVLLSNNPWKLSSDVALGLVATLRVMWEASNPSLLSPGMATKIIYKKRQEVHSLYATLAGVSTVIQSHANNETDPRYVSTSRLTLLTQRENDT